MIDIASWEVTEGKPRPNPLPGGAVSLMMDQSPTR
jgi:hypothetical protein